MTTAVGHPPLTRRFEQEAHGGGELLACSSCLNSRGLDPRRARGERQPRRSNAALPVDRRRRNGYSD
jgi:hypothetical protein